MHVKTRGIKRSWLNFSSEHFFFLVIFIVKAKSFHWKGSFSITLQIHFLFFSSKFEMLCLVTSEKKVHFWAYNNFSFQILVNLQKKKRLKNTFEIEI